MNRERKLSALRTFLRWQLGSRILNKTVVHPWVSPSKFYVRRGETGLTGNIYCGLHEYQEMSYLLHVLREDEFFVDVGANVGSYSILAGAVIGCKGCAIEPVPGTFGRLVENMRLNHLEDRFSLVNSAVGEEQGSVRFSSASDTMNHVIAEDENRQDVIEVDVAPLDEILKGREPGMIKIDVEGFETAVIAGAQETLQKTSLHTVIMELNGSGAKYGFDESKILKTMSALDFKPFRYDPGSRELFELQGKNTGSGNTLFIRDVAQVKLKVN